MRKLLLVPACLILAFLAAPSLSAQAIINVNPAQPRVSVVNTFTLSGVMPAAVTWDFGDGSTPSPGGTVATHTFLTAGSFIVRATYQMSLAAGGTTVQRSIRVVEPRSIAFKPTAPNINQPVIFTAQSFLGSAVNWNFGDGTSLADGAPLQVTHTYAHQGTYLVKAMDFQDEHSFTTQIVVGASGPSAPFSVSFLSLRWEDGLVRRTVAQNETGLAAYADLKYEGTGLFQAQWMVDGVLFRSVSQQLTFAKHLTLVSGQTTPGGPLLSLPTGIPGEHIVSLRVLQPGISFEVPVIRYFVTLGKDPEGPVLKTVLPRRIRAGEEVELQISGSRLTADMELHLGHDMSVVEGLRLIGPETALVKVFVAPSAKPGTRILRSSRGKGGPEGSARLDILPARKRRSGLN